ncbi:MAG: transporter [Acidobacteria bacterium]|nr:transporter [Acidobacteriota bacterium]
MDHPSLVLTLTGFALVGALAAAERVVPDSEMSSDRPGFSESTDVLAPGSMQFEGGVLLSRQELGTSSVRSLGGPFLLVRMGLVRRVELRWSADGYGVESELSGAGRSRRSGMSDAMAGFKVRVFEERRHAPALSVIGAMSLPIGSRAFSSGGREPQVKLCWSKSLPGGFDTGGNVNFQWRAQGGGTGRAESFAAGHKIPGGMRLYGEVYRISPIEGEEDAQWITNGGGTKSLGRQVQVDVEVGHTVRSRTPGWFVGAGLAVRLPHGLGPVGRLFTAQRIL